MVGLEGADSKQTFLYCLMIIVIVNLKNLALFCFFPAAYLNNSLNVSMEALIKVITIMLSLITSMTEFCTLLLK